MGDLDGDLWDLNGFRESMLNHVESSFFSMWKPNALNYSTLGIAYI